MSSLATLDYVIIVIYLLFALSVGAYFTKRASTDTESFFVGDKKLPWWIAGTSIVATTFAADTPLAVTGLVAGGGISGNWVWWCWGIAHLVATFFFARLWRRAGVITDAEITELRYSGKAAAALRGVKAIYFGIFINCLTMAWVIAAMVKITRAFFDVEPGIIIAVCIVVSVLYTTLGGFRGVVVTDIVQFCLGMTGAIILAWLVVDSMGGIGAISVGDGKTGSGLLGALTDSVEQNGGDMLQVMSFVPTSDHKTLTPIYFIVLLVAGWWRLAEGSGYIVQRLAACKDEGHAQGASLWFAIAHNALRPWPWIIVALAAMVVYPVLGGEAAQTVSGQLTGEGNVKSTVTLTPGSVDPSVGGVVKVTGVADGCDVFIGDKKMTKVKNGQLRFNALPILPNDKGVQQSLTGIARIGFNCGDKLRGVVDNFRFELKDREMAYPLMMKHHLPVGLLGLVIASLLAAFMSTIDTHTNWGASYLVQDIYKRFLRPDEDEKHYVRVSRQCIVLMAILAGIFALFINSISSVWIFLITLGAGLGSVTAARWFWKRVTPHAEFAAMFVTTLIALALEVFFTKTMFGGDNGLYVGIEILQWQKIILVAVASLITWIPVAIFGPQNSEATLKEYAQRVRPPGASFASYIEGQSDPLAANLLPFALGLVALFGTLFGIGTLIFGPVRWTGGLLLALSAGCLLAVVYLGKDQNGESSL